MLNLLRAIDEELLKVGLLRVALNVFIMVILYHKLGEPFFYCYVLAVLVNTLDVLFINYLDNKKEG